MYLYNKSMYRKFKFKFEGLEGIEQNYSQSLQDMFVLSILKGKLNGTFLEIGAYHPSYLSNTLLLEQGGWNGISIDIDPSARQSFESFGRKAKVIIDNAVKINYEFLLANYGVEKFDYLQLDIEPMQNTLLCLKKIPLDKYDFSVISYEHDHYDPQTPRDVADKVRKESEEILEFYGYIAVAKNIENLGGDEFESWWVNPKHVDKEAIQKFMLDDVNKPIRACQYFGLEP